ncbi:MAG: hypothetical protein ACRC9Q_09990 [Bacteroidales bacterium]
MRKKILGWMGLAGLSCCSLNAFAQAEAEVGTDLVSSYLWRGSKNSGPSVQPYASVSVKGLTIGTWGSVAFEKNGLKEIDLYASYTLGSFTFGISDYWWDEGDAYPFYQLKKGKTSHSYEANLAYELPIEKFPLTVSWNTVFAGWDYDEEGKRCYSSYLELLYPFDIKAVEMQAFVGVTPWYSPIVLEDTRKGFSVCNIGIGAGYTLECGESLSFPFMAQLVFNPATEEFNFALGASIVFQTK